MVAEVVAGDGGVVKVDPVMVAAEGLVLQR
jgi:hypothetical protein